MPTATFSAPINAPVETVWEILLDKIEHPEHYAPGICGVRLHNRADGALDREMTRCDGRALKERIKADATDHRITFALEAHPMYDGTFTSRIDGADGDVSLHYELSWMPHSGREADVACDWESSLASAVLQTKLLAEARIAA